MALFSFHCECYKAASVGGLDKHNRRLNKHYGNKDIDKEKTGNNRIYIAPQQSLYKDCKYHIERRVVQNGGRITRASVWLCECVFSYPEDLPPERLDEYNTLIIDYMGARLGKDNILMAVCHRDEGGLPHLHLDVVPITEDGRLSRKTLITRDFITSIHKTMPLVLRNHGFNVAEYTEMEERKEGGLSAKEYKKKMEAEKKELSQKLDNVVSEYNSLVDKYNMLLNDKKALEQQNSEKAREIVDRQQERGR